MNRKTQRKTEKKVRIIKAAANVFSRKGYAGANMADIAVEAGLGKGTLYEYFDSKDELFFTVFEWFTREIQQLATVSASSLGAPSAGRLEALNDALMKAWAEMKDLFSLFMEFWAASSASQFRQRFMQGFKESYDHFRGIVAALIREGMDRGEFHRDIDPEAVAAVMVGAWDGLFLQAWFEEDFDPLVTSKRFLRVLIRGLTVGEASNP